MAKKFTLKSLLHRIQKLTLTTTVSIDGEVKEDYPIAWVKLRGPQDPVYKSKVQPFLDTYLEDTEEANTSANFKEGDEVSKELSNILAKISLNMLVATVACSIEDWDQDFFECEPTLENIIEILEDENNNSIYNQIVVKTRDIADFLPIVEL